MKLSRRHLVKSMVAGTGLTIGYRLPRAEASTKKDSWVANPWVTLQPGGTVLLTVERTEMGQGALQGQATIFIEEADLDPNSLKFIHAGPNSEFDNREFKMQVTGGSNSLHQGWDAWRELGAQVRALMLRSAAERWRQSPRGLTASMGYVYNSERTKKLSYFELLDIAAKLDLGDVKLKDPSDYKYIGKESTRFDADSKCTGTARFGIDAKLEGLKIATVVHCPYFKGRLRQINNAEAIMSDGVYGIYEISSGVAVVANNYWLAEKAAAKLDIEWEDNTPQPHNFENMIDDYRKSLSEDGATLRKEGDIDEFFENGQDVIEAEYIFPFVAHKTMEPMNTTCSIKNNRCHIITPTQAPALAVRAAMAITGFSEDHIELEVSYLGGGFGRRLNVDYVSEAVEIAHIAKTPIKLIWSREEDSKNDFFRPMAVHKFRCIADKAGFPLAWQHKYVTQTIAPQILDDWVPAMLPNWTPELIKKAAGALAGSVSGMFPAMDVSAEGAKEFPYAIDNLEIAVVPKSNDVPVGFWRSVGHSLNGPAIECFMDELIEKNNQDPVAYRLNLLKDHHRHYKVLEKVAEMADWSSRDPDKFYGVAQHASFKSYTAQIVQASRSQSGRVKIEKVFCVADCGIVVNPDVVSAQLESGVIFGLSAALYDEVPIENNQPKIGNFQDTPILRISETPEIITATVKSNEKPTGVGEIAVPSIIPAVVNALSRALGKRIRRLPIREYLG